MSPLEPFSNIGLSIAEDLVAIGSLYLIYKHPYLALAIVLILLGLILWFAPKIFRAFASLFRRRSRPTTS